MSSNNSDLKSKALSGLFWQMMQRTIMQLISFGVSVVLARMLMPEDFGVVALSGMFLVLIGIFIDSGLGTALVQKKDADDLDYNTVFLCKYWFCISCVYACLCACSFRCCHIQKSSSHIYP